MRRFALPLCLIAGFAGCDDGPSGPGELTGVLETPGPILGAATLEVSGKGITGFSGSGGTRVFHSVTDQGDTYRLVLIAPTPGQLQFRVSVQDLGAKRPATAVVNVVSGGNVPLPATADYRVRFSGR
jgi:hypothetical protein